MLKYFQMHLVVGGVGLIQDSGFNLAWSSSAAKYQIPVKKNSYQWFLQRQFGERIGRAWMLHVILIIRRRCQ